MFDLKIHNFLLPLECHFSPLEVSKLLDTTDKLKNVIISLFIFLVGALFASYQ